MKYLVIAFLFIGLVACTGYQSKVNIYVTTADKKLTMAEDSAWLVSQGNSNEYDLAIELFPQTTYQEMDGFGAAIPVQVPTTY